MSSRSMNRARRTMQRHQRFSGGTPMGKTIDQLQPDDTTLHEPEDVRGAEWLQFAQAIDYLLGTGEYTWAEDTLTGIQATVRKLRHVSEGQRRAVNNIEAASGRQHGRRYEGFRGRSR